MLYTGMLREFASYGFIVIAINHNDGSCMYTLGEPITYDKPEKEDHEPQIMGNEDGP